LRKISTGSPQGLLTRTCARSWQDTKRISLGPFQELLTRTCTRSCKRPLCLTLTKIFMPRPQDRNQRTCCLHLIQEPPKNLPRASHKSFHTSTSKTWHLQAPMQGPLRENLTRISRRSRDKDRYKIMQGPLTGFHQDLDNIFSQGPQQDPRFAIVAKFSKLFWAHVLLGRLTIVARNLGGAILFVPKNIWLFGLKKLNMFFWKKPCFFPCPKRIRPLLKNSFSTNFQGTGPWEGPIHFSKLFQNWSWSQEKKGRPFPQAIAKFKV